MEEDDMDAELDALLMSYDPEIIAAVRQAEKDIAEGKIVWDRAFG